MCATVEIEADDENTALSEAESWSSLPKDGDYLDDSFRATQVLEELEEEKD